MLKVGDILYYFVSGDETGTMHKVKINDQSEAEYYTKLLKDRNIEMFEVK